MLVELVRASTSDNIRLDGVWSSAPPQAPRRCCLDAVILLHGVAGNFYSGNLFDRLQTALLQAGVSCLRVNTRGHDSVAVSWGRGGPQFQGAAYELVDQSRFDVRAWVEWLVGRGAQRVGLLGHSLGAIKALYTAAYDLHPAVQCILACSPPRLSYSAFLNSEAQPRFFESLAAAREQIERGTPEALIMSQFPTPVWITAAGFMDKYGPEEKYNIVRFIERVPCPSLATYGELELASGGVAFAGLPDELGTRRRPDQQLDRITIPGADHAYTGVENRLAEALVGWLAATCPPTA